MSDEARKNTEEHQNAKRIDDKSMAEIIKGIRQRLPVKEYADRKFSAEQMKQIRLGMKNGISYQLYAAPYISPNAMKQWRKMLENGKNDKSIIDFLAQDGRSYNAEQVKQIRIGMKDNIDVKIFANPDFSAEQMKQIRLGAKNGIDYDVYADECFSAEQMHKLRVEMLVARIIDFIKEKFYRIYNSMKEYAAQHVSNRDTPEEITKTEEMKDAKLFTLMRRAYDTMAEKNSHFEELTFDEKVDSIMKEFERVEEQKCDRARVLTADAVEENEEPEI